MSVSISRRAFLKLAAAFSGSLAYGFGRARAAGESGFNLFPSPQDDFDYSGEDLARIATTEVPVYSQPNGTSPVGRHVLDELVNIYYEISATTGPEWNPVWYRVWGGYMHSAHIQKVKVHFNPAMASLPKRGHQLVEVTVPYTRIFTFSTDNGWQPKNKLYFETTHWVVGVDAGPDGRAWYRLYDELLETEYRAPAFHFRPIPDEELAPISPDVPEGQKHIDISLQWQTLTAYEGEKAVFETRISSGIFTPDAPPAGTRTPTGSWNIYSKMPTKHMGNADLTGAPDVYTLPGVPWTSFFVDKIGSADIGIAFHGAYWHNNYGVPMSHGCINMRPSEAHWLFRWTTPVYNPDDEMFWEKRGNGTIVHVLP